MKSYTYVNGVMQITTYVRHGFNRFHTMNAQYRILDVDRFKFYQFVSYNTNIMQAMYDNEHDYWIISFNGYPYDYSPTTSRQVNRFIRENCIPITPYEIKEAYLKCNADTPDIASFQLNSNILIRFIDNYFSFKRIWR